MTIEELSEWTGVDPRTLLRWRADANMPCVGTKRRPNIRRVQFLRWAAAYSFVRDKITRPECLEELIIYHKAKLYDTRADSPILRRAL